ncbi:MAG TPA: hypothetical protein VIF15_17390 [Polyangiaceae bacterium]|jgi:hypothetical protein
MGEQATPDLPLPALGRLEEAHDAEYVAGFPVHVALTLHGDPFVELRRIPRADWRGVRSAVGVKLVDPAAPPDQRLVRMVEAAPIIDDEIVYPRVDLPAAGQVRMLVDLSELLGGAAAPPAVGAFEATVTYAAGRSPAMRRGVDFPLVLRRPTSLEEHTLRALAPLATDGWGPWAEEKPPEAEGLLLTPHVDPADPLRLLRVMRFLMYGPTELADVDPAMFDVLGGVYAPDAEALRAEVLAARGDRAALAKQLALARAATPGLGPWLASIESGTSFLGWMRDQTRKRRRHSPRP